MIFYIFATKSPLKKWQNRTKSPLKNVQGFKKSPWKTCAALREDSKKNNDKETRNDIDC